MLEDWLCFDQFGYNWDLKGWKNVRFDCKKGSETFYHLVARITATHITRKRVGKKANWGPKEWAEFKVDIICLNPLATVHFSSGIEESEQLIDHIRCLPSRLKKDGYPVNENLRKICKVHIKQRLKANS